MRGDITTAYELRLGISQWTGSWALCEHRRVDLKLYAVKGVSGKSQGEKRHHAYEGDNNA